MNFKIRLGKLIRAHRQHRQYSVAQAVEAAGGVISCSSWHEYERGEGEPRFGAMLAISLALRVPVSEFVPGDLGRLIDAYQGQPIDPCKIYKLLGKKNGN